MIYPAGLIAGKTRHFPPETKDICSREKRGTLITKTLGPCSGCFHHPFDKVMGCCPLSLRAEALNIATPKNALQEHKPKASL